MPLALQRNVCKPLQRIIFVAGRRDGESQLNTSTVSLTSQSCFPSVGDEWTRTASIRANAKATITLPHNAHNTERRGIQNEVKSRVLITMVLDFLKKFGNNNPEDDDGLVVEDDDAAALSYVGIAAYDALRTKHNQQHHVLWNATSGTIVGNVHQTPPSTTFTTLTKDPKPGHSDWLPIKLAEIIARTTIWCDVMSLGPPDGLFMDLFQEALLVVAERAKERADNAKVKAKEEGGSEEDDINPVIIRMMFGNIVGMPTNCEQVLKDLTKVIPKEYSKYIRIWVGAWRKGVSWNHAKIIAVDGKHLWTGGHNLWDQHYLKHNPVHDLSLEMKVRYVPTNVCNCCRGWLGCHEDFRRQTREMFRHLDWSRKNGSAVPNSAIN